MDVRDSSSWGRMLQSTLLLAVLMVRAGPHISISFPLLHVIFTSIVTMSAKSSWNACTVLRIFYPRPVSEALTRV